MCYNIWFDYAFSFSLLGTRASQPAAADWRFGENCISTRRTPVHENCLWPPRHDFRFLGAKMATHKQAILPDTKHGFGSEARFLYRLWRLFGKSYRMGGVASGEWTKLLYVFRIKYPIQIEEENNPSCLDSSFNLLP